MATTLIAADATTVPRTEARALLRWALRFLADTSSMRLSRHGIDRR
jgi:hypothetical protein